MGTMSVSVPDKLREKMGQMDEVNWSAVARKAFEQKVKEVDILQKIANKSKLTEKDAQILGNKINKSIAKKFREM